MTTSTREMGKVIEGVFRDLDKENMDYKVLVARGCGCGGTGCKNVTEDEVKEEATEGVVDINNKDRQNECNGKIFQ